MERELEQLLVKGAEEYSVHLDEEKIKSFGKYKEILLEWNEKINLTAIEEDKDIILKHFIDSLSIMPYIRGLIKGESSLSLVDVGTGAGFPGIPVKIAAPEIKVTLLDSLEKRVKFLKEVVKGLGLTDIEAMHGRAEEYGVKAEFREKFDVSTARAVASLPVLLEYCLPFTKVGGLFIAMKGSNTEEISSSKRALEILGGEIVDVKEITLPWSDMKRNIILIKKLRQTPAKYPRKAGKPAKEPLI
ncbi:16S rRNA (guanine(527)-N(7))-methyltransferase RsmG [Clostridium thermosuccinogenes]|uniref:Ribosomal RNA small subunit methyltransferase G n=1 Tax=Clostridium thermosuccinogenes TaxID=84032 RepID=A0A2K2F996_9CLOT|nr:16S rRNA (guanine(527)-N(7))-methyltransferase RsmG [Pseudoclostridium thermosuccinogenes]AUS98505.1 16S rRNA (guanine(527)-N(7))-methyltransferase RsmG [Pseudoclostridium thermosuccinogenes]PNT94757.1 16S rRNA (guanine(527)-N(7))-methyltransferase RsmG [Pseudoclostridium thermosuccinogenes]PNT95334.1 16S rRNA (guanine(527)-N(7))-methyltransferase RsmG [Pseudoclostridium thermosuccinogenes]